MKISILLVLLCSFFLAKAEVNRKQRFRLEVTGGLGTYTMNDLKDFNQYLLDELPFEAKIVANFPPSLYYRVLAIKRVNRFTFGPSFTYFTTGSRISSADYSGEYNADFTVNSYLPAIVGSVNMNEWDKLRLGFRPAFGVLFSSLKISEQLIVYDETLMNDEEKLAGLNLYLEPAIAIEYDISPKIGLGFNLGYGIQMLNQGFYKDKLKNEIQNPANSEKVKPGWNGLRLGLSLIF